MNYDSDTWDAYPQHRWIFNKLLLSEKLGHNAGPGGTSVTVSGNYIVRPVYNLSGMGVGAKKMFLEIGDYRSVGPGEFWCEWFYGPQMSVDYEWVTFNNEIYLQPIYAFIGYRSSDDLCRVSGWKKIDPPPMWDIPSWVKDFRDVPYINIKFIAGSQKIVGIHLRRRNNFPLKATKIIPIWADMDPAEFDVFLKSGYEMLLDSEYADGHLKIPRIGYFYK